MPNYSFVIDSEFNPLSFDEISKPFQMYREAYKEQEDVINNLDEQASLWESKINPETDTEAAKQYKAFADELRSRANELATKGLTPGSRRNIFALKGKYNSQIKPIEDAYEARKAQAEEQRKAQLNNPHLYFNRDASLSSLDEYIKNPDLTYKSISGNSITEQVSTQMQALSKELRENPNKLRKLIGNDQYYEYVKERGFNSSDIYNAIMRSPDALPELTSIVDNVINASGVNEWNDKNALDRTRYYANLGLWSGVGNDEAQLVNNTKSQARYSAGAAAAINSKPIELIDENGKPTGKYFRKDLGTEGAMCDSKGNPYYVTDKEGNNRLVSVSDHLKDERADQKHGYDMENIDARAKAMAENRRLKELEKMQEFEETRNDEVNLLSTMKSHTAITKEGGLGYVPGMVVYSTNGEYHIGENEKDDIEGFAGHAGFLANTNFINKGNVSFTPYNANSEITYVPPSHGASGVYSEALTQNENIIVRQAIDDLKTKLKGSGMTEKHLDKVNIEVFSIPVKKQGENKREFILYYKDYNK